MDTAVEQSWAEIFALAAALKTEERHRKDMELALRTMDQDAAKKKVRENDEKDTKELEEVLATSAQIAAFDAHLDSYDTKTVEALMENREALDRVRDGLRRMTDEAYVLPDGRHVFRTADGRQVFDEHGLEVSKAVDPDAIGDNHPTWEAFKAAKGAETKLETEQHALLDFQAKVDDARERVGKGGITKKQLDDLDADLKASAPPTVRQKLGLAAPETDADAKPRPDQLAATQQRALIDDPSRRAQPQPVPM